MAGSIATVVGEAGNLAVKNPTQYRQWKVTCEHQMFSRKHKRDVIYVRARTKQLAEMVGMRETGLRHARAVEYHPELDSAFRGWIGIAKD